MFVSKNVPPSERGARLRGEIPLRVEVVKFQLKPSVRCLDPNYSLDGMSFIPNLERRCCHVCTRWERARKRTTGFFFSRFFSFYPFQQN